MTSHRILQLNAVSTAACAVAMLACASARCRRSSVYRHRFSSTCSPSDFWYTPVRWHSRRNASQSAVAH